MEQTKFTRFKRIIKHNIFALTIIAGFVIGSLWLVKCNAKIEHKIEYIDNIESRNDIAELEEIIIDDSSIKKDSIKGMIVDEVYKYIKRQAPTSNIHIPMLIVNGGLANSIDICFMMAQTQIETNFGTLGAGREKSRRSMFGVAKSKYSTYEESIEHYCKVLKSYYLTHGRTEKNLMKKYVTHTGRRYAENTYYEKDLSNAYAYIKRTTKIVSLQEEYKKISSLEYNRL